MNSSSLLESSAAALLQPTVTDSDKTRCYANFQKLFTRYESKADFDDATWDDILFNLLPADPGNILNHDEKMKVIKIISSHPHHHGKIKDYTAKYFINHSFELTSLTFDSLKRLEQYCFCIVANWLIKSEIDSSSFNQDEAKIIEKILLTLKNDFYEKKESSAKFDAVDTEVKKLLAILCENHYPTIEPCNKSIHRLSEKELESYTRELEKKYFSNSHANVGFLKMIRDEYKSIYPDEPENKIRALSVEIAVIHHAVKSEEINRVHLICVIHRLQHEYFLDKDTLFLLATLYMENRNYNDAFGLALQANRLDSFIYGKKEPPLLQLIKAVCMLEIPEYSIHMPAIISSCYTAIQADIDNNFFREDSRRQLLKTANKLFALKHPVDPQYHEDNIVEYKNRHAEYLLQGRYALAKKYIDRIIQLEPNVLAHRYERIRLLDKCMAKSDALYFSLLECAYIIWGVKRNIISFSTKISATERQVILFQIAHLQKELIVLSQKANEIQPSKEKSSSAAASPKHEQDAIDKTKLIPLMQNKNKPVKQMKPSHASKAPRKKTGMRRISSPIVSDSVLDSPLENSLELSESSQALVITPAVNEVATKTIALSVMKNSDYFSPAAPPLLNTENENLTTSEAIVNAVVILDNQAPSFADLSSKQEDLVSDTPILPVISIVPEAHEILSGLEIAGGQHNFLVGGYVRDEFNQRETFSADLDIVTSASADAVEAMVKKSYPHVRYLKTDKLFSFMHGNRKIDIWLSDALATTPSVPEALLKDAESRDFNIGCLYADKFGRVYDPTGRASHCAEIDTIIDPMISFKEDPIRMLRAIYFSHKLKLPISERVKDAIMRSLNELPNSHLPSLVTHIDKFVKSPHAENLFKELVDKGILSILYPEFGTEIDQHEIMRCLLLREPLPKTFCGLAIDVIFNHGEIAQTITKLSSENYISSPEKMKNKIDTLIQKIITEAKSILENNRLLKNYYYNADHIESLLVVLLEDHPLIKQLQNKQGHLLNQAYIEEKKQAARLNLDNSELKAEIAAMKKQLASQEQELKSQELKLQSAHEAIAYKDENIYMTGIQLQQMQQNLNQMHEEMNVVYQQYYAATNRNLVQASELKYFRNVAYQQHGKFRSQRAPKSASRQEYARTEVHQNVNGNSSASVDATQSALDQTQQFYNSSQHRTNK